MLTDILEWNIEDMCLIKLKVMEKVDLKISHSIFLPASLYKNSETFNKIEGELLQHVSIKRVPHLK